MKKILVIDDERECCKLLADYLKKRGFELETAFDGISGLEKIKCALPDLVLCDISMPGLSGIEVLKRIKEYNPHIIVIMLTGYGSMESALECLKLGAYDHIAKPVELEKLLILLKEALNMDVKKLKYKILIIDDEPQLVESIAVRFKASGYTVQTAPDGVSGINKFKEEEPDLVILDIMMPGLSGLDTLKELKQLNSSVPVIMLTAYGTPQSAIEALRLGAYDHLAKPFNTETLLEMIKKALEGSV
jgi:DNA-binding NtrC family response regulator